MEAAAPFPEPIVHSFIHSQSVNSLMLASVPNRTGYMEICCVCVDVGYGGTGENKRVQ
jgi:hypothetical protein